MGFLPARMSRLLVGGHRADLERVISTLHAEGVVHVEDYQDPTGTTRIGTPLEAGEKASELLVAVRGLQKALGAEQAPAILEHVTDPARLLEEAKAATAGATARAEQARARMAAIEAEETVLRPLEGLDVDPSLASTLTTVRVFIGFTRADPRAALAATGVAHEAQVAQSASGNAVAVVVAVRDAAAAERALAENGFSPAVVPPGTGTPAERLARLASEHASLAASIAASDEELAKLRDAWGPRLAGLERVLVAEVERTQAPLKFGVTDQTFHIEGWVPAGRVAKVKAALAAACGDKLYFEDLGDAVAANGHHGHPAHGGPTEGTGHAGHDHTTDHAHGEKLHGGNGPVHADEDEAAHHAPEPKDEPPVHLQNPKGARPYEYLLGYMGRPRYSEIDPSKLMLVFFPLFFGLMVGDLAIGLAIMGVGFFLKKNKVFGIGGPAIGNAILLGGLFSALIGLFVFGEALGIHFVVDHHAEEAGELSWESILGLHLPYADQAHGLIYKTGHAPIVAAVEAGTGTAGIHPAAEGATGVSALLAPHSEVHLSVGGVVLGWYSKVHDTLALLVFSMIIGIVHVILGLAIGIRNVKVRHGVSLAIQEKAAWLFLMAGGAAAYLAWGSVLGWAGLGLAVASVALLWMGAAHTIGVGFIALLEIPGLAGNILSYTRLAAIGASKAGMAIAFANIAFDVIAGGDVHSIIGWVVYLIAQGLILVLAIIAGTLQSLRLQFVEFFSKFFQGGGRPYVPFGRRAA